LLTDVSIPADRHVTQREAEKKLKWKNLCVEIKRMWKNEMCDCTSNNWSHRSSNKGLQKKKIWEVIPAIYSIDLLKKTAIL